MNDKRQGIVHVIGPEQGATLPGMTVVCGDSHTSTHGAFGALAHGIGTSEVEHVLATQTLLARKAKNMLVRVEGTLPRGCSAKDIVLAIIGQHRHRRRHRLHDRVRRRGHPRAVDGRAHDRVQHGHRGGRARRPGGGGRHHARLRQGPPVLAGGRRVGPGRRAVAHAAFRRRRAVRPRGRDRRRHDPPAGHLGHVARDGAVHRGPRARSRAREGRRSSAARWSAR